jgi:chorismate-pyruvate lyase
MRGRGKTIASALTDALSAQRGAGHPAAAAAFAEACGWPLAREVALKGVTRDGRLLVVASTQGWADQVERHAAKLCERVNARLGRAVAQAVELRVGPLGR